MVLANANAKFGRGGLARLERLCVEARVELVTTASPEETRRVAAEAARAGCRCVIAAGGDGTVHHVLNVLAGTDTALGIVPLGTANDLARALRVPLDLEGAMHMALAGNVRRIDLGRLRSEARPSESAVPGGATKHGSKSGADLQVCRSFSLAPESAGLEACPTALPDRRASVFFGGVATFGLGAEANRKANQLSFGGGLKYTYALLRTLLAYQPPFVDIHTEEEEFEEPLMIGLIGNSHSYGGGMRVTPHALMDDGLFDVCLVSRMSRLKLLACFPQVFFGAHLQHPEVTYWRTRRLWADCERPLDVFADGEFLGRTPAEFEIVPAALSVIGGD